MREPESHALEVLAEKESRPGYAREIDRRQSNEMSRIQAHNSFGGKDVIEFCQKAPWIQSVSVVVRNSQSSRLRKDAGDGLAAPSTRVHRRQRLQDSLECLTRIGLKRDALPVSFGVGIDADHGSLRAQEPPAGSRPIIE